MSDTPTQTLKRLVCSVRAQLWLLGFVILGNLLYAGVDAYATYLFKPLLDKGFIDSDLHFLAMLPYLLLGLFVVRGIGNFSASYCIGRLSRAVVLKFRIDVFRKILYLPASYFDQMQSGHLLAMLTYHVEQVTLALGNAMTVIAREGFFLIGLLVVMFYTNWRLSCIIFLVLPFVIMIVRFISRRFRVLSQRIQTAMGDVTHIGEETIGAFKQIRIYHGEAHQDNQFSAVAEKNYQQEMKVVLTDSLGTPIVQLLGAMVLALFITLVFWQPTQPMLTAGEFVTMLSALLGILKPVKNLTQVNNQLQRGIAAAQTVFEFLDEDVEQNEGVKVLREVKGRITFDAVDFAYDVEKGEVLSEFSLDIQPGETVAFVGRSGSGKTTLMSLLCRFYDATAGEIQIDGHPIQSCTLESLREQIAYVSQEAILLDESIYDNIAYGAQGKVTEDEVIAAAKSAHIWDFIQECPEGLHTRVGAKGTNISGGQRQRIAIARAIIKHAPILIFDEATSALDNTSERHVKEALDELIKTQTTLIIAHRLTTIQSADRIVVMDGGRLIEMGSHDELMAKQGAYAELYEKGQH